MSKRRAPEDRRIRRVVDYPKFDDLGDPESPASVIDNVLGEILEGYEPFRKFYAEEPETDRKFPIHVGVENDVVGSGIATLIFGERIKRPRRALTEDFFFTPSLSVRLVFAHRDHFSYPSFFYARLLDGRRTSYSEFLGNHHLPDAYSISRPDYGKFVHQIGLRS